MTDTTPNPAPLEDDDTTPEADDTETEDPHGGHGPGDDLAPDTEGGEE